MSDARAFSGAQVAARAWYYLSPYPEERGLAGRRYREHAARINDDDGVLQAIGELAVEGYPARALTFVVVSERVSRIRWMTTPADQERARQVYELLARLVPSMRMTPRGGGLRR